jgi:hypothetical protein
MPYHLNFIGMSFEGVQSFNPKLGDLLMVLIKVAGVCFLGLGIFGIGIALKPFRRAERWVWVTAFPAMLIPIKDFLDRR